MWMYSKSETNAGFNVKEDYIGVFHYRCDSLKIY